MMVVGSDRILFSTDWPFENIDHAALWFDAATISFGLRNINDRFAGLRERVKNLMGDDFWPYGVEQNRVTLDAFLRYADEQGVSERRVALEEMFAPECYFTSKT